MRFVSRVHFACAFTLSFSFLVGVVSLGRAEAQTFDVTINLTGFYPPTSGIFELDLQSTGPNGATLVANVTAPSNSILLGTSSATNTSVAGNGDITMTHPAGSPSSIGRQWLYLGGSPNIYTFSVSADPSNNLTSTVFETNSPGSPFGSLTYTFGSAPIATGAYSISNYNSGAPTPTPELSTWVSFGLLLALFGGGLAVQRRRDAATGAQGANLVA